jgi:NAD(P)-dependent dehydrogenase (short-subunit alcohol dehydrogenase family)
VSNKKIWFITGAGRGMGADFAKAALAAGHAVVATGRNSDAVSKGITTGGFAFERAGRHGSRRRTLSCQPRATASRPCVVPPPG